MARFLFASILLVALACACSALPQEQLTKDLVENSPLEFVPAEIEEKFFWNFFRPRPWIPLPGILIPRPTTTTRRPPNPPPPNGDDDTPDTGDDDTPDTGDDDTPEDEE